MRIYSAKNVPETGAGEKEGKRGKNAGAFKIMTAAVLALALTACGTGEGGLGEKPGTENHPGLSKNGRPGREAEGKEETFSTAAADEKKEEEKGRLPVQGRQFVNGFGLLEENSPAVWQLEKERNGEFPFTESALGKAELISAVQQEGVIWLTVCVTDRSVEEVAKEETEEYADTDSAWFSIEEDGGGSFYGYSPLIARMNEETKDGGGEKAVEEGGENGRKKGRLLVEGEALDRADFYPSSETYSASSPVRLPSGGFAFLLSCRLEDRYGSIGEPKGEYRVHVAGFGEPISFEMAAAPVFSGEEKPEGIFWEDGWGFLVRGRIFGNVIATETYTVPRRGCEIFPGEMELYCFLEEDEFALCEPIGVAAPGTCGDPAEGSCGGSQGQIRWFRIPDGACSAVKVPEGEEEGAEPRPGRPRFTAVFSQSRIVTEEESGWITLPVTEPGETRELDQTVRFSDAEIRLLRAEAEESGKDGSSRQDGDGEPAGSPGQEAEVTLHVSTEIENDSEEMPLEFVMIERRTEEKEGEEIRYSQTAWPEFGNGTQEAMTGFLVPCSRGETSVEFLMKKPSYIWLREVEVPVDGTEQSR